MKFYLFFIAMGQELDVAVRIAECAGDIVMKYYGGKKEELGTHYKQDEFDPVTQADLEADAYIRKEIRKYFPQDKLLTEESNTILEDFTGRVRMVDPLDGTKDFVGHGERFSVMIGLCEDGIPVLGVVYCPVTGDLYFAEKSNGAYLQNKVNNVAKKQICVSDTKTIADAVCFTKSKFSEKRLSNQKLEARLGCKYILDGGSVGVVLGEIARGVGECYILTNTRACKRDSCAPQVILEEAGGRVTDVFGDPIDYLSSTKSLTNLFVATNGVIHSDVLQLTKDVF